MFESHNEEAEYAFQQFEAEKQNTAHRIDEIVQQIEFETDRKMEAVASKFERILVDTKSPTIIKRYFEPFRYFAKLESQVKQAYPGFEIFLSTIPLNT